MFETRVLIISQYSTPELEEKINTALNDIRRYNPNAKITDIKPWPDTNGIPTAMIIYEIH